MIGILATPVFTRMLGGEEYGSVAFYLSVVGVVSSVISPLVSGSRIYGVVSKYKSDFSTVTLSAVTPILAFCGGICIVLFTFKALFPLDTTFILLVTLQVISDSIVLIYLTAERYNYEHKRVAALTLTEAALSPIISFLLIRIFGKSYLMRVLGLLLPPLVIAIVIVAIAAYRGKARKDCTSLILSSGIPLIPLSLITSLSAYSDRLLTAFLLGNSGIAKYSVAHTVGAGLLFAVSALSASFIPWMLRRMERAEYERVGEVSESVIILLCAGGVFLIVLSPEIMRIFAPADYYVAIYAVIPIALSAVPIFISSTASAAILHTGGGKSLIISRLAALFTAALLGVALIPSLSYLGAGLSALASECAGAIINCLTLKKRGSERIIRIGNSRLALVILISIYPVLPALYENLALRILTLIIPSVIALNLLFSRGRLLLEG